MPIEKKHALAPSDEVAAPSSPHLATVHLDTDGGLTTHPIVRGNIMAIIMDPKDAVKGIYPIALMKVSPKRLEFICPCGNPMCSRKVVFNGTWSGVHPHGTPHFKAK